MRFSPGETNVICTQLERSLVFYRDVLGYRVVEEEDGAVRLAELNEIVATGADAVARFLPDLAALLRRGDATAGPTARALAKLGRAAETGLIHAG